MAGGPLGSSVCFTAFPVLPLFAAPRLSPLGFVRESEFRRPSPPLGVAAPTSPGVRNSRPVRPALCGWDGSTRWIARASLPHSPSDAPGDRVGIVWKQSVALIHCFGLLLVRSFTWFWVSAA